MLPCRCELGIGSGTLPDLSAHTQYAGLHHKARDLYQGLPLLSTLDLISGRRGFWCPSQKFLITPSVSVFGGAGIIHNGSCKYILLCYYRVVIHDRIYRHFLLCYYYYICHSGGTKAASGSAGLCNENCLRIFLQQ